MHLHDAYKNARSDAATSEQAKNSFINRSYSHNLFLNGDLFFVELPTLTASLLGGIPISYGVTAQQDVIRGNVAKLPTISHLNLSLHQWAKNLFTYAFQFASPPHQIVFAPFRPNGRLYVKAHQCQRQRSRLRNKRHIPRLFVA